MAMDIDSLVDMAVQRSEGERMKSRQWTETEEEFLRTNLGYLTEAEIAKSLGRTETAVRLRWKREMKLTSPSKAGDVITANKAAMALGIETHKICHWADRGLIPYRTMAGGKKIRLIKRIDFEAWCLDPENWIYFDWRKVRDAELKRKLRQAVKAWGDEWWPSAKMAHHYGVETSDVKRHIQLGRLPAKQVPVSLGGRHPTPYWRMWFVKKSDALRFDPRRYHRKKA